MRKVLIIADGIVAKEVLESITSIFVAKNNEYIVIYKSKSILPTKTPDNFTFLKFDATSFSKLYAIFTNNISEIFIIFEKSEEIDTIYQNIRKIRRSIKISILDYYGIGHDDKNLSIIDANKILSSRVVDKLPNVPVTAQNIGLGAGEIMEVAIPFGSSFVYRSIGSIAQKNWKIVGVYRSNSLILAKDSVVILPNDSLLILGDPLVLKNIYQAIKRELGQFPAPFGNNIYLYIDMLISSSANIYRNLDEALELHKRLKNKRLIIRVANPTNSDVLKHIKEFERKDISVNIDYFSKPFSKVIVDDKNRFGIGMVLVENRLFEDWRVRRGFYQLGLPLLKIGKESLNSIAKSVVLLSSKKEIEKISPVVFDISSQLELNIDLYDFNPDGDDRSEIVEHFENLSKIYVKELNIITTTNENPIRWLNRQNSYLQILPFTPEVAKPFRFWYLSTDLERLFFKLPDEHQLFVPVTI